MKQLLFRADDLGYSEAINYGILKSVKEGVINNVGIMVNMPASKHGVDLIKDYDISFGQHTNICVGRPLTDPKKIPSLTTKDGFFKSSKVYREAKEDFVDYEEVMLEIEAQYHAFKELFGKNPDYFEGHAIASKNFFNAMQDFAEKNDLTYSGLPEGMQPNSVKEDAYMFINKKKAYLTMESMSPNYDPYEMIKKVIENKRTDGVELVVFHPGYLDNYIFEHSSLLKPRVVEVEMLTSQKTLKLLSDNNVTLLEYKDL